MKRSAALLQLLSEKRPSVVQYCLMAKIGYTRKPGGQNRVPPSTLVPGRILLANARPDPTLAEFQTGPPDSGYSPPHRLPGFNHTYPIMAGLFDQQPTRARTHADASSRHGGTRRGILRSTWSCVRQNFNFVVQSVCDVRM